MDIDLKKSCPVPAALSLRPEFMELNPLGTVPLLVDGDARLTEKLRDSALPCDAARLHPLAIAPVGTRLRRISGLYLPPCRCDDHLSADGLHALCHLREGQGRLPRPGTPMPSGFTKRLVKGREAPPRKPRLSVRGPLYGCRYLRRLCADSGGETSGSTRGVPQSLRTTAQG